MRMPLHHRHRFLYDIQLENEEQNRQAQGGK
jgi:hypothetical protein